MLVENAVSNAVAAQPTTGPPTPTSPPKTGKTVEVQVGPPESPYQYVPASIAAAPGDTLTFSFWPRNHSVVEADYLAPCVPRRRGSYFYSGIFNSYKEDDSGRFSGNVSVHFFGIAGLMCS